MKRKINVQNDNLMLMNENENERCNHLDKRGYASTAHFQAYIESFYPVYEYTYIIHYHETLLVEYLFLKRGKLFLSKKLPEIAS